MARTLAWAPVHPAPAPEPKSQLARNNSKEIRLEALRNHGKSQRLFRMSTEEHNGLKQLVEAADRRSKWVQMPNSNFVQLWGTLMHMVLAYSFIFYPVQVAFIRRVPLTLFCLNRCVDIAFLFDIVLNFFLGYQPNPDSLVVKDLAKIRYRYLSNWFFLDVLSLLSSLGEIIEFSETLSTFAAQGLRIARVVTVFRFLKLIRVAAGAAGWRAFLRCLRRTLSVNHVSIYVTELLQWMLHLLLIAHFVACVWGCISLTVAEVYNGDIQTWVSYAFNQNPQLVGRDDPLLLYLLSIYWSLMTLATIGYGDITPKCLAEYIVATLVMVVSATMWTILMASACSVITLKDEKRLTDSIEMESLIDMCRDYELDSEMTALVKNFVEQSRRMHRHNKHQEVLKLLSPALQGQVTEPLLRPHLERIPFLQGGDIEVGLMIVLARELTPNVHSPSEWIVPQALLPFVNETVLVPPNDAFRRVPTAKPTAAPTSRVKTKIGELDNDHLPPLTIMKVGVALHQSMLGKGSVWHEDCILSKPHMRDGRVAQAIGFCAVYTLSSEVLAKSLQRGDFPNAAEQVRTRAIKLATIRLVKRAAQLERTVHGGFTQCITAAASPTQHIASSTTGKELRTSRSSLRMDSMIKVLQNRILGGSQAVGRKRSGGEDTDGVSLSSLQASIEKLHERIEDNARVANHISAVHRQDSFSNHSVASLQATVQKLQERWEESERARQAITEKLEAELEASRKDRDLVLSKLDAMCKALTVGTQDPTHEDC